MNNKNKSLKVQKISAQIQSEQSRAGESPAMLAKNKKKVLRTEEKAAEEKRKKEEAEPSNPVQVAQKVPFGADPKTIPDVSRRQISIQLDDNHAPSSIHRFGTPNARLPSSSDALGTVDYSGPSPEAL